MQVVLADFASESANVSPELCGEDAREANESWLAEHSDEVGLVPSPPLATLYCSFPLLFLAIFVVDKFTLGGMLADQEMQVPATDQGLAQLLMIIHSIFVADFSHSTNPSMSFQQKDDSEETEDGSCAVCSVNERVCVVCVQRCTCRWRILAQSLGARHRLGPALSTSAKYRCSTSISLLPARCRAIPRELSNPDVLLEVFTIVAAVSGVPISRILLVSFAALSF